jgi:hypothetical protein
MPSIISDQWARPRQRMATTDWHIERRFLVGLNADGSCVHGTGIALTITAP